MADAPDAIFPHAYWSAFGAHSTEGPCVDCGELIGHRNHHDASPLPDTIRRVADDDEEDEDGEGRCEVCGRIVEYTPRDGWTHRDVS